MMPRLILALLVPVIFLYPGVGQTDESGPSSYDECITETMKGVASDVAARAIISSCRNMFPEPAATALVQEEVVAEQQAPAPEQEEVISETSRSLTAEELSKLSARAFILGTAYRLTFDNRNEDLTITEVTIAVWDKSDLDLLREYKKSVRIRPQESGSVKYNVVYVGEEDSWAWKVASAKGID